MKYLAYMSICATLISLTACSDDKETPNSDAGQASALNLDVSETAETPLETSVKAMPLKARLTPIAEGLDVPWGLAFLPSGDMLVTERDGRLNRITPSGEITQIIGTPATLAERQGGYFDIILDPNFASNRLIYLAYAKGTSDANATAIYKARLNEAGTGLEAGADIYQADLRGTAFHFGGRLQFLADGTLLLTLGDAYVLMEEAQSVENTHGTIVRLNTDGSIPSDNPFYNQDGANQAVFTYGHRNAQGLVVDPQSGVIFAHEHGPQGGDELNILEPGKNYGWPAITYGINYDGSIITDQTEAEGMEQPVVKWVPSIAPSGMMLYSGDQYPDWQGDLFIGAMRGPAGLKLVRLDLDADFNVLAEHAYLEEAGLAYRDVVQGPGGHIYVLAEGADSGLYKVSFE